MQVAKSATAAVLRDAALPKLNFAIRYAMEIRMAIGQFILFSAAIILRAVLGMLLGPGCPAALMTALLSSGAMGAWRSSQWSLEVEKQRMMDTDASSDPRCLLAAALRKTGGVHLRFGGWVLPRTVFSLSLEDTLCLAVCLAQLALLFFFENWGLAGPTMYRWVAIVAHSAAALAVLVAVRMYLLPVSPGDAASQESADSLQRGGGPSWLAVTLGHWASTTWAAASWWHSAAMADAEATLAAAAVGSSSVVGGVMETDLIDKALLHTTFAIHVPIVATTVVNVANVWNASRAREPVLLFLCTILAGISMAASCCVYCSTPGVGSWLGDHWRASVLPLFCAMSAWMLWQELVRSLSAD